MEPPDSTRIEKCGELLKHAKDDEQQVAGENEITEAIEYLEIALHSERPKRRGDKQPEIKICLAFGLLYRQDNQVQEAIKCFKKALILAKELEDKNLEIEASIKLAGTYKLDGRFQIAMRYYKNTLEIAEEQKDRSRENMAKKAIGELSKIIESSELWKWEESSKCHREKFIKLLEYVKNHPVGIKEINEVRFCCSEEFRIGMGRDGTRVYVGLGKDGKEMAVKRLLKDACTELAEQEKKVSDELNIARSNYVVKYSCLDSNSDEEFLFLIMDLCEETLENFVHRSSLDDLVKEAPNIIRRILKGLADLHRGPKSILHRDVQPSNILRKVDGNWLLADFGISRILPADSNTHQSNQRGMEGCNWRAVESSYPSSNDTDVLYKKESDIQVAGMVAFYVVTKGQHPFGGKPDQLRNLIDGKPVGLETLEDPVLKDLLFWMLSRDPEDRPSAEEALKHPYLQPEKQQFKMLCKVGKEREIQMQDGKSDVVQQLNSDFADWKSLISADVLTYFCSDFLNGSPKTVYYGSSWTECLRFIENVSRQWNDKTRPKPQPDAFYSVSDPKEYFLNIFPTLVVRVHRIIRSSDWKERADLKEYFTKDYDEDLTHARKMSPRKETLPLQARDQNEREKSENADIVQEITVPSSETKQKHEEIREKNSWFKDTFLDSTQKLKEEVHEDLKSFPWFCGAYGLARPNKKIPHLHLFVTVKRGTKKSVVRRDLKHKYKCDAKEYFRLLQEPKRKPRMKYLADSSAESSTSPVPSVLPLSPVGGIQACISGNPVTDMPATGTLTIFCYKNGYHYALTCFHVGCANDETRFKSTFNVNVDNILKIRSSLPTYVSHAREKRYWFTEREFDSNNELIDSSNCTPLGDLHKYHFDSECDILSVKVPEGTEINCKMTGVTSLDLNSIWAELLDKFAEWNANSENPVEVKKIGFSSGLTCGHVVTTSYNHPDLYKDAIAVKGSFLEDGDSGSLVFFLDKNNQKQVFAYGVCEIEELLSEEPDSTNSSPHENASPPQPTTSDDNNDDVYEMVDVLPPEQPESTSSTSYENVSPEQAASSDDNDSDDDSPWEVTFDEKSENSTSSVRGPYFICLRLDTALEKLGLHNACINDCGRN